MNRWEARRTGPRTVHVLSVSCRVLAVRQGGSFGGRLRTTEEAWKPGGPFQSLLPQCAPSIPRELARLANLRPHPKLLNQNLRCNGVPGHWVPGQVWGACSWHEEAS